VSSITLMDDDLSKRVIPGLLIFSRILRFDKFNMTVLCFFAFNGCLDMIMMIFHKLTMRYCMLLCFEAYSL
jgi:hypothetical protein